jgi:hypothetical protein
VWLTIDVNSSVADLLVTDIRRNADVSGVHVSFIFTFELCEGSVSGKVLLAFDRTVIIFVG